MGECVCVCLCLSVCDRMSEQINEKVCLEQGYLCLSVLGGYI